ncbi:Laccase-2 [Folsomia candida]|uniref:Laccase-2 n=1 Tax=Folsomia candida TaxID=158441 RepID=A0A226F4M8_FOLCA|nr:Laccase-2 [Folsomia candida]
MPSHSVEDNHEEEKDGDTLISYAVTENGVLAPDNFEQVGKVINGQFPGTTITIVENRLPVPLTIHWHAFVTQADIPPNGKYTYCMFIEDEPGTHMYHAHTQIDIIWIHGALIAKDNNPLIWARTGDAAKYHYDEEPLLILEQLYHEPITNFFSNL